MAIGNSPMLSLEEPIQQRCYESMAQMEDLLSRTSKLTVTDEEGWEINEDGAEDIGKLCLIGRLCTRKPFTRSLLKNILCRLCNLGELDWDLKIKKITDKALFLILSFKQNNTLERILGRTPWVLNAGFLILERMNGIPPDWETTLTSSTISGLVLNLPIKAITNTNMLRFAGMAGEVMDIQESDINQEFPNSKLSPVLHSSKLQKGKVVLQATEIVCVRCCLVAVGVDRVEYTGFAAAATTIAAGSGVHESATINGQNVPAAQSENQGRMADMGGGDQGINVARMGGEIGGDRAVVLGSQQIDNNGKNFGKDIIIPQNDSLSEDVGREWEATALRKKLRSVAESFIVGEKKSLGALPLESKVAIGS
ncbi:hypothetical protein F8388_011008 [Cannabis sativa]|uniref:DUF4283 domain-containing protein n=1 Tax=Cannabis sativa TaxID=3483 RepID=A0A7J6FQJ6_CANSA|nr:hypothetical protein F8388_011008 [Cannabis sativa]KAF4401671.1 hypothetical protein G4B88_001865 [Cannabis sativa]